MALGFLCGSGIPDDKYNLRELSPNLGQAGKLRA